MQLSSYHLHQPHINSLYVSYKARIKSEFKSVCEYHMNAQHIHICQKDGPTARASEINRSFLSPLSPLSLQNPIRKPSTEKTINCFLSIRYPSQIVGSQLEVSYSRLIAIHCYISRCFIPALPLNAHRKLLAEWF